MDNRLATCSNCEWYGIADDIDDTTDLDACICPICGADTVVIEELTFRLGDG